MDDIINEWAQKEAKYKERISKLEEDNKAENSKLQQAVSLHSKDKANYISQITQNEEKNSELEKKLHILEQTHKEEKVQM